jgi:hypothetical protein
MSSPNASSSADVLSQALSAVLAARTASVSTATAALEEPAVRIITSQQLQALSGGAVFASAPAASRPEEEEAAPPCRHTYQCCLHGPHTTRFLQVPRDQVLKFIQ